MSPMTRIAPRRPLSWLALLVFAATVSMAAPLGFQQHRKR